MIKAEEYIARRTRLMASLPADSIVVVPSADIHTQGNGTDFPFVQETSFFYLTGFNEPNAWLLLSNRQTAEPTDGNRVTATLFCLPKHKQAEIWNGRRLGVEAAHETLHVDQALPVDTLKENLSDLLNAHQRVYFSLGKDAKKERVLTDALATLRRAPKQSKSPPDTLVDLAPVLGEMRVLKSPGEIAVMQQAAQISAKAHCRAMQFVKPGVFEYQLEAEIHHEFTMAGAKPTAYGTIVGSGENACILHYTDNQDAVKDGDLVLIDAGAYFQGYAADITRTFPVNGQFSEPQAALYQLVLDSQLAALALLKPGNTISQAMDATVDVMCKGLLRLGILQGELDDIVKNSLWRQYFMHGLGHWLGMDVHDVGKYKIDGQDRPLQPGMVLTVEPGLYIDSDAAVDPKWHGLGIRIEDDIVITQTGHCVLTEDVPKTIVDIEALMSA